MVRNRILTCRLAIMVNTTIADSKRTCIDHIQSRRMDIVNIRVSKEKISSHRHPSIIYAYDVQTFIFRETRNDSAKF